MKRDIKLVSVKVGIPLLVVRRLSHRSSLLYCGSFAYGAESDLSRTRSTLGDISVV